MNDGIGSGGTNLSFFDMCRLKAGTAREFFNFDDGKGNKVREGDFNVEFDYNNAKTMDLEMRRRNPTKEVDEKMTKYIVIPVLTKLGRANLVVEDKGTLEYEPVALELVEQEGKVLLAKNSPLAKLRGENIQKLANEITSMSDMELTQMLIGVEGITNFNDLTDELATGEKMEKYNEVTDKYREKTGNDYEEEGEEKDYSEKSEEAKKEDIEKVAEQSGVDKKFLEAYLEQHPDVDPNDLIGTREVQGGSGIENFIPNAGITDGEKLMMLRFKGAGTKSEGVLIDESGKIRADSSSSNNINELAEVMCSQESSRTEVKDFEESGIGEEADARKIDIDQMSQELFDDEQVKAFIEAWMIYALNEQAMALQNNDGKLAQHDAKIVYEMQKSECVKNMAGAKFNGKPVDVQLVNQICDSSEVIKAEEKKLEEETGKDIGEPNSDHDVPEEHKFPEGPWDHPNNHF